MRVNLNLSADCNRLYIAYSGGIDSHVLLHWCAAQPSLKSKITAVYVNHGLQVQARQWGEHCAQVCGDLGVDFIDLKADARAGKGDSPEQAARAARYSALKPLLKNDDVLLVAHHREDQLETFLLQLFRGSGPKGLSAMPEYSAFGKGYLLRPMLDASKAEITRYAHEHVLRWVDDPSNQSTDYDRNFLRNQVLPFLKQRWPGLDKTVARSARHCANQQGVIGALSQQWLERVESDGKLNLTALAECETQQQILIVRCWLERLALKMPSENVVRQIVNQALSARQDAGLLIALQGHEIRRYRGCLYCLKIEPLLITPPHLWHPQETALFLTASMRYEKLIADCGVLKECWQNANIEVRFRQGGEKLSLPGREGRRDLKDLFQEAGIPPWERGRIPLIFLDGQLALVGDLWISAEFYNEKEKHCVRLLRRQTSVKAHDGAANVD